MGRRPSASMNAAIPAMTRTAPPSTWRTDQEPGPPTRRMGSPRGGVRRTTLVSNRRFMLGLWLVVLIACTIGATYTLLPLRLAGFGASDAQIGVTFVLAALASALVTPWVGRVIDRRGIVVPLTLALAASGLLIAALTLPRDALPLAVLTVLALGAPLAAAEMRGISVMTDAMEHIGAALAFGTMLLNLAWASGETVGAPAAATLSRATSDAVPLVLLAAALLLAILPVLPQPRRA